jgi:hypothetical protein
MQSSEVLLEMDGNATNQASESESVNTSASLAIYPRKCRDSTSFLEADFWTGLIDFT